MILLLCIHVFSEAWKPQLTFITTARKKKPSRFRVNYNRVLVFWLNYPFKKPGHPVSYTYHKVGVLHETEDDPVEQGPQFRLELHRDPLSNQPDHPPSDQLVPKKQKMPN